MKNMNMKIFILKQCMKNFSKSPGKRQTWLKKNTTKLKQVQVR